MKRDELKSIVESAFKPLECIVDITKNYSHAFGFKVYLPNDENFPPYEKENVNDLLNNHNNIKEMLLAVRSQILAKGVELDEWSFPETD